MLKKSFFVEILSITVEKGKKVKMYNILSLTFEDIFNLVYDNFYLLVLMGSIIAAAVHWTMMFVGWELCQILPIEYKINSKYSLDWNIFTKNHCHIW